MEIGKWKTYASFCLGSSRPSSRILASMNNLLALSTENEINAILNIVHFISSHCHTFVVLNFPFRILNRVRKILKKRRLLLLEIQQIQPVSGGEWLRMSLFPFQPMRGLQHSQSFRGCEVDTQSSSFLSLMVSKRFSHSFLCSSKLSKLFIREKLSGLSWEIVESEIMEFFCCNLNNCRPERMLI